MEDATRKRAGARPWAAKNGPSRQVFSQLRGARSSDEPEIGDLDPSLRARLRQTVLSDLSLSERVFIVLRYVERMTNSEIALVLNLSRDQVGALHERIVQRLGQSLQTA